MQTATTDKAPADFCSLAIKIREAGLLEPRPGYYSLKIGLTAAVFIAGWAALFLVGDSWASLGVAVFLAVMFTQFGLIAHDAGHQQIFRSRVANRRLGLAAANALIGLSFGWWVPKHSAHHAHPNQVDRDPDIGAGRLAFTFTDDLAGGRHGITQFLARKQAWLFLPLLLLEGAGLHISGIQMLLRQRDRSAAVEALLMAVHAALYLAVVLWVLSPLKALAFIAVQQALFGLYLGCIFAPNHKGMPILEKDEEMSFVKRQVITARNVGGGPLINFMLGGLNYQIEHHLFPSMPRPNLARAQSIIRPFCLESGLGYCEDSLLGSYRQAVRHLSAVATAVPVASIAGT